MRGLYVIDSWSSGCRNSNGFVSAHSADHAFNKGSDILLGSSILPDDRLCPRFRKATRSLPTNSPKVIPSNPQILSRVCLDSRVTCKSGNRYLVLFLHPLFLPSLFHSYPSHLQVFSSSLYSLNHLIKSPTKPSRWRFNGFSVQTSATPQEAL